MKKLFNIIKSFFIGKDKVVKRVELTTGIICVHILNRVTERVRIEVEQVYN
jgi:hypothetical protein